MCCYLRITYEANFVGIELVDNFIYENKFRR